MTRRAKSSAHALLCAVCAAGGIALSGPATASAAASEAEQLSRMEQLIEDLGADSFATRQSAETELSTNEFLDGLDEAQFVDLLARETLDPEQRHRIRRVYTRWFSKLEHAGMGISFRSIGTGEPVLISLVVKEFPSHTSGALVMHDVITAIDGIDVANITAVQNPRSRPAESFLRASIISREPGDTLRLRILRAPENAIDDIRLNVLGPNGQPQARPFVNAIITHPETQTLEVDVPLGSYNKLAAGTPAPGSGILDEAARLRLARMGVDLGTPELLMDGFISIDDWAGSIRKPKKRVHSDLLDAHAGRDKVAIRKQNKMQIRATRALRAPNNMPQIEIDIADANARKLSINDPIVIGDAKNITPVEKNLIQQQGVLQTRVRDIDNQIAQQNKIIQDRTRPERERFLAQGQIETLKALRSKLERSFAALRAKAEQKNRDIADDAGNDDDDDK